MKRVLVVLSILLGLAVSANAQGIQITEWMYSGTGCEFVEFTNMSAFAIDMTDWSYSDSDAAPFDLVFGSVFGVVNAGESVILTDINADTFRTQWGLGASVKVYGPNSNSNLGRSDAINLYDAYGSLVDSLVYDDSTGKGPRTQGKSCTIPSSNLGLTTASSSWTLASAGDVYGSWASTAGDLGNPGTYYGATVPEPAGMLAIFTGLTGIFGFTVRRRK